LKDVGNIVHPPVHEVIAGCRQLSAERLQRWVNALQRCCKLGEISDFKTWINHSMKKHVRTGILLNINSRCWLHRENRANLCR